MGITVGIFDSGLGGLSAAYEFEQLYKGKRYIYFGDTARVPYGSKSTETIQRYAVQDTEFLLSRGASVIIAACGTVSANAIDVLREKCAVPVIGVVEPAAEKAARIASEGNGRVIVLGTAATVKSGAYERAIAKIDSSISVCSVACPMFVPLVENGYTEGEAARLFANEYLGNLASFKADAVVLGCTHYPHLSKVIGEVLSGSTLVNSGKEAALAITKILSPVQAEDGKAEFFVSDSPESFSSLAFSFLKRNATEGVQCIDIEGY